MTQQLNEDDYEALWAEVRLLREQLDQLTIARDVLIRQHEKLRQVAEELQTQASEVRELADEVADALDGSGA